MNNNESLNKDKFFDNLSGFLLDKFKSAEMTLEISNVAFQITQRLSIQIKYDISLFQQVYKIGDIPVYNCTDFYFVPVSNGNIADKIVLRFSIQRCKFVNRLYLMTLFPLCNNTGTYVSDQKLLALSILNGQYIKNSIEISQTIYYEFCHQHSRLTCSSLNTYESLEKNISSINIDKSLSNEDEEELENNTDKSLSDKDEEEFENNVDIKSETRKSRCPFCLLI